MKQLKKFFPLKALSVLILGISLFTIVGGFIWGVFIWENEMDFNLDNFIAENYRETPKFEALVNTRVNQLNEYIKLKQILETDGRLDYNKVVLSFDETGEGKRQEYTIKDLMALNEFYVEDVYPTNNSTLSEIFSNKMSGVSYYEYRLNNGYIQILPGTHSDVEFIVDFLNKKDYIIAEDKIVALSKVKEIWNTNSEEVIETPEAKEKRERLDGEMIDVYSLNDIAYRFTYYVSFYTFYEELFSEGSTVFNYWIYTPELTLSNLPKDKIINSDTMLDTIKESAGNYITYDSEGYQIATDLNYVNRSGIKGIEDAISQEDNKEFKLGIEIPFLLNNGDVQDEFVLEESAYREGKFQIEVLIISIIISFFLAIVCAGYLISAVGHRKDVEGIALSGFDHVYSEIAAAILIALVGITLAAALSIVTNAIPKTYMISIFVVTFIFEYIFFMIGMASLLRRIKAKTLWKNSVCGHFIGAIKKIIKSLIKRSSTIAGELFFQRSTTTKVTIVYVGWVFSLFFTVLIMFGTGSSFLAFVGFLLLAGGNLAVLYFLVKMVNDYQKIISGTERIAGGEINYKISDKKLNGENKRLVEAINNITCGLAQAIESSIKNERMKTDLITNVSHDIKTPLTSIINYVDLLKRENIEDEKIQSYLEVLDNKSQRLKTLTEDLVEASKLSSGNMEFIIEEINLVELVTQVNGEFIEKYIDRNLTIIPNLPSEVVLIKADGRRVWRILENLYNNASKYSMEGTRVYADLTVKDKKAFFSIKNISEMQLNIKAEELTERFIRGESSRTTEGSGLGLSIARSLTELMNGSFEIYLDGDLFRVTVSFPLA